MLTPPGPPWDPPPGLSREGNIAQLPRWWVAPVGRAILGEHPYDTPSCGEDALNPHHSSIPPLIYAPVEVFLLMGVSPLSLP